jgi:hypothetical protein
LQSLSYAIVGGVDAARFTISPTGALSFVQAPNFEAPVDANGDNVYVVTVQASDGVGGVTSHTINVTITPVNDNSPVFTSLANVNVPENTTSVMTVTATDADRPLQAVSYSIVGGADAAKFVIMAGGVLKFISPPDFEAPTDANGNNVYEVAVQASDGLRSTQQTINVTVTPPPAIADYGDAPDTEPGSFRGNYQTRAADNGPRHMIVPGLRLGASVDAEGGLFQNPAAGADDASGPPDDEDGLSNPSADLVLTAGARPTVSVRVTNQTTAAATLYGWIDYNADGAFHDATERVSLAVLAGTNSGIVTLVFPTVPLSYVGETYARFRLSTDAAAANSTGPASDGEIEDYRATIVNPSTGAVDPDKTTQFTDESFSLFGGSAAAIGDLDGDGVEDLAVGAAGDNTGGVDRGAVYILFMNPDGTTKSRRKIAHGTAGGPTLSNYDSFGQSVAALGDIDGDGVLDLIVGADGYITVVGDTAVEVAYLLFLNPDGTVKSSRKITHPDPRPQPNSDFGRSVAGLGDLDGDGVNDAAVGARRDSDDRGAIYVMFLNADGTVKNSVKIDDSVGGGPPLASGGRFGQSIASLGDLDGDGVTDLAVGGMWDDTGGSGRGAVHILFLHANGTVKARQKIAHETGGGPSLANRDEFGFSVAALGDLDGDGVTDLGVGATGESLDRGALHVLFLNADGTAKSNKLKIANGLNGGPSLVNGDNFGSSVAAIGDLDGDGIMDLAVGAQFGGDGPDPPTGSVRILFLRPVPSSDFNHDGLVDAGDLPVWRANFGTTSIGHPPSGDADGDKDVDGTDFLVWQRNLARRVDATALAQPATAPSAASVWSEAELHANTPDAAAAAVLFAAAVDAIQTRSEGILSCRPEQGIRETAQRGVASSPAKHQERRAGRELGSIRAVLAAALDENVDAVFEDDAILAELFARWMSFDRTTG